MFDGQNGEIFICVSDIFHNDELLLNRSLSPSQCSTHSVAVGYENGSISLISMTGERSFDYSIHDSPVMFVCSASNVFASVDCDNRVFIWSTKEDSECIELEVRTYVLKISCFSGKDESTK